MGAQRVGQFGTGHRGHHHVGDQQVRAPAGGHLGDRHQRVGGHRDRVPGRLDQALDELGHLGLVLDDQDPADHRVIVRPVGRLRRAFLGGGQVEVHGGAHPGLRLQRDETADALHDPGGGGQAEPGRGGAGGEERLQGAPAGLGAHAAAGVGDHHVHQAAGRRPLGQLAGLDHLVGGGHPQHAAAQFGTNLILVEVICDLFDADYLTTQLTNPISLAHQELKYDYRNDLISSAYLNFQILKNLSVRSTIGLNFNERKVNGFNGPLTGLARNNAGLPAIVLDNSNGTTFINTNVINYKPDIGPDHSLDLLVGEELNKFNVKSNSSTVKWFPINITADEAFASIQKAEPPVGSVQDKPTSNTGGNRQLSFFARASYSYKGKYLATLNYRRDGSSFFAPGRRWGDFPSAQIAWRASEEEFVKDLDWKWLNSFKVRASYGMAGNNRIGQDLFRTLFSANSTLGGYAASDGSVTTGLIAGNTAANSLIKWEKNISANLGFDVEMFNNRVSLALDLYDNRTKDLLLLADLPSNTGYTNQQQNIGKTQNRGLEIQLNALVAKTKDFSYNAGINFSFNKNKILQLQNGLQSYVAQSGWVNSLQDFKIEVGRPVGQFYGFVSDGRYTVDDFTYTQNTTTGVYTYTLKPNVPNSSILIGNKAPQPGDMKVKKLSSSSSMLIGDDDKTVLGTSQPKFTGGFSNNFAYKNFDLSISMNFAVGNEVYNANSIEFSSQYNVKDNNLLSTMNNRWRNFDANGVKVTDPVALTAMNANTTLWTPTPGNYALASYAIEDGSFLKNQ